jgi:hypothetical protein
VSGSLAHLPNLFLDDRVSSDGHNRFVEAPVGRITKCAPEPGDCEKQQIAYIADTLSDTLIGTNLRGDLKFYTGP